MRNSKNSFIKHFDKFLLIVIIFTIVYNSFHVFVLRPDYINHDEGNYVYCSWRVSEGEVPYKDFFDHHISGSYFLLGGIFKIFGASMNIARAMMVLVCVLTNIFIFLIAKKLTSKFLALISVTPFILVQPIFKGPLFFLDSFVALFATASAYFLINAIFTNNKKRLLFFSGSLASLSVLFKQNAGFYWIFLGIFVIYFLKKQNKTFSTKNFLYFILGLAIPFLFYLCYLIYTNTLGLAFEYLFLFNFTNVNSSVGREFPYGIDFHLAILPCILASIISIFIFKQLERQFKNIVIFINLWMISTALLLYPLFHSFHAYPALAPAFILLAIGYKTYSKNDFSKSKISLNKLSKRKVTAIFIIITITTIPIMSVAYTNVFYSDEEIPGSGKVVEFVKENTEKGDKVLVLSFDPQINFLSNRRAPGKYQYIHRCFQTENIEREVVESCVKEDVKYIIWGIGFWSLNFKPHELKIINSFIEGNYTLIENENFNNFQIYELNSFSGE